MFEQYCKYFSFSQRLWYVLSEYVKVVISVGLSPFIRIVFECDSAKYRLQNRMKAADKTRTHTHTRTHTKTLVYVANVYSQ